MLTALRKVQPVFAFVSEHLDEDVSLAALARQSGLSVFHLHRVFRRTARETPKQFSLRLRLERSAVMLLLHRDSVLDVALDCGFQSHEVFCRAFRKRFGVSPGWYRKRGFRAGADAAQAEAHAALVRSIGPCVGLMRWSEDGGSRNKMEYSITKKMLNPQPVLIVRRRVKPDEIANTLAQTLGQVFLHAQQNGMAIAGQPFTRYLEWGPGLLTIEAGLPVAAHAGVEENGDVRAGTLGCCYDARWPLRSAGRGARRGAAMDRNRRSHRARRAVGSLRYRSGGLSGPQGVADRDFLARRVVETRR